MSDTVVMAKSEARDFFRPRRLGHANLFVSDYEEAQKFYFSVAGIHEAYRQPDNMASFVTNGNTYHDFGLTDVRSPYAPKGQKPGLFHIALELENEVDLVDGLQPHRRRRRQVQPHPRPRRRTFALSARSRRQHGRDLCRRDPRMVDEPARRHHQEEARLCSGHLELPATLLARADEVIE